MKVSVRNLSIQSRFYLLLSIIIVILLLIAIFFLSTLRKVEKYKEYSTQIDKLNISYLNLRRFEQHFLLRYQDDPAFFTTGENVYLEKHKNAAEDFSEILDNLQENKITTILNLSDNYTNIRNYKETYVSLFREMANKTFKRGSSHAGIIGEIHNSSSAALELTENTSIQESILRMQKQSENYLYSKEEDSYREFLQTFKKLHNYISTTNSVNINYTDSLSENYISPAVDSTEITKSAMVTEEFAEHINNFKLQFSALREIDKELGLTYKKGLEGKINPQLNQIVVHTTKAHQISMQNTKKSVYMFLIGIGILLVILIRQFSVSISKPLSRLYDYTEPLSKGILPKKFKEPIAHDEVSDMLGIINSLIMGLRKTTDFAITLGKGIFDTDYAPLSAEDNLGNALIDMRQNLNQASIEDKKRKREDDMRKWSNEGVAKFNDILRQSPDDIEELSNRVIRELVDYLGANQGAMYIYNDSEDEEEKYLELTAAYAYGKEKKRRNKIYPGEGLLGTAAIEKESIYMTDIPDSYLSITSGLGHANPRSLLIVPMKVDEDVFGVVEIASFNEFGSNEIKFTEEVSDNISASLSMTKINLRTSYLLKQSQTQAEQMSKQEQEMRENLEDLQDAQKESARREAEMASILSAIDNSSLVLEIDTKGIITSANIGMLELMGVAEGRIVGMQHRDFVQIRSAKEYNELWNKLRTGEHIRRVENININNVEAWISTVYAPIKDESGNIINIMALGTDLTEPKQLEIELKRQAEALSAQEEEMRQNLEELHTTQEEMSKKQIMLENANTKLKKNQKALKISIDKSEKQETELKEKVKELNLVQIQIEEQHSRLIKTNEELEEKEKEIRNRFDAVDENNMVAEYKPDGTLIDANESFLKTFDYTIDEIRNRHQRMFIPPNLRKSEGFKQLWQLLRKGTKINEECQRVDKNGDLHFFKGIYTPILDFDGKPVKILEILTDITEQKSTESLLLSRNKNVDTTASVIEFDPYMKILNANDNFCKTVKYTQKELIGENHSLFIPQENRDSERYLRFKRELKRGNSTSDTFLFIDKDDELCYLNGSYSGVKDPSGKVISIIFSGFDITEYESGKQEIEAIETEIKYIKKKYSKLINKFVRKAETLDIELEKQIIENYYHQK